MAIDPNSVQVHLYDPLLAANMNMAVQGNQDNQSAGNLTCLVANVYPLLFQKNTGNWDRQRGNEPLNPAPLATQAATVATRVSGDQINYNGRGIALHVKIANLSGVPTFTPQVQWKDNDGNYVTIWTAAAALSANGDTTYLLYPGAVAGSGSAWTAIGGFAIPRFFRVNLNYTGNGTTDKADTTVDVDVIL